MLTIKILGKGCINCDNLEKMCFNILAEKNIDADVRKITDLKQIAEHGVFATPALIINDKLYCQGKVPVKSTLVNWILSNNI